MKRIAIIDDEQDARQSIKLLLTKYCPNVMICGEADSVASGYALIERTKPLGILLDISMEDGTGFDLLDKFPVHTFQTIFITAYDEFALMAFEYHALDYLLKPVNPEKLVASIELLKPEISEDYQYRIRNLLQSVQNKQITKITLTSQEGMIFLPINQIVRLESNGNYTTFYTINNERHLIVRALKEFEELMSAHDFFRIHQSHIINISFIKKIIRQDGDYLLLDDGSKVPIARRRKDEFMKLIKRKFLM